MDKSATRLAWGQPLRRLPGDGVWKTTPKSYARRAREERLAAEISQHHAVRQRHTEMAEAYDARLRSIAAEEESRQTFHLVSAA